MRKLGLEAIYPKPNLSKPGKDHLTYPYLLKGMAIGYSDQVWATDITYIRIGSGFIYLLVIMDWHSRFVIEVEVSNSLESSVFVETLKRAMKKGAPEIFNSDQGSQFTAVEWLKVLQENKIAISMVSSISKYPSLTGAAANHSHNRLEYGKVRYNTR